MMMKAVLKYILFLLMLNPSVIMAQKGIDVSRFQDSIKWKRVAQNKNIKFVYVKATEGASIRDKMYKYNVKKAREEGLLVGSYHVYSSRTTAQAQFANFKKVVGDNKQDLIPVLDIEATHCHKLSMARVDKMLSLMEKEYGAKPMIYTSERLYKTHFNIKKYKKYHFFIANYNREPRVAYTLWQYTQHGRLKGISGFVDLSRFSSKYDLDDIKIKKKGAGAAAKDEKTETKDGKKDGTKTGTKTGTKSGAKKGVNTGAKKTTQTKKAAQKPAQKKAAAKGNGGQKKGSRK